MKWVVYYKIWHWSLNHLSWTSLFELLLPHTHTLDSFQFTSLSLADVLWFRNLLTYLGRSANEQIKKKKKVKSWKTKSSQMARYMREAQDMNKGWFLVSKSLKQIWPHLGFINCCLCIEGPLSGELLTIKTLLHKSSRWKEWGCFCDQAGVLQENKQMPFFGSRKAKMIELPEDSYFVS